MATIKSYTSVEQSKKLAKILPLESADMYYCYSMDVYTKKWEYDITPTIIDESNQIDVGDIPCWSLAALLGALPKSIIYTPSQVLARYCCKNIIHDLKTYGDNPVDACYEMIIRLHELNLL